MCRWGHSLGHLDVSWNANVSDEMVARVGEKCAGLVTLDLSGVNCVCVCVCVCVCCVMYLRVCGCALGALFIRCDEFGRAC